MENIEEISMVLIKPNVVVIKADREAYIDEYVEATKDREYNCSLNWSRDYKCGICNAEFETLPSDAKYCPACLSTDLKIIPSHEMQIGERITLKIIAENRDLIRNYRSKGFSIGAIAAKFGVSISEVSEVLRIKQSELPQEQIDYVKNAYLSGRPVEKIKEDLGISVTRVKKIAKKLHQEIMIAQDHGTRPEDIGKTIGIHGHDQAIIDIVNRTIPIELCMQEVGSRCRQKKIA